MNATEKKYLMTRIEELKNEKLTQFRKENMDSSKTFKAKWALVKAGKVSLRKDVNQQNDSAFNEFDFSKYPEAHSIPYWETPVELAIEVTRIKDEIMLGSAEKAQKLLKSFENWKMK